VRDRHTHAVHDARGRSPHPLFDFAHYLGQSPALLEDEDPVSHYAREGSALGLTRLGLSHYLEHMLFKGTPTARRARSTLIEGFGGNSNAFTSYDFTHYDVRCRPPTCERHGALADIAVTPASCRPSWRREEGRLRGDEHPAGRSGQVPHPAAVGDGLRRHPYRRSILGHGRSWDLTRDS
jgi:hypothetical protein